MFYRQRMASAMFMYQRQPPSAVQMVTHIDLLTDDVGEKVVPDDFFGQSQEAAERHITGYLGFMHSENFINFN